MINEDEERLKKEEINSSILELSKALEGKKDDEIAASFKETLPVFENFGKVAEEVLKKVNTHHA